MTDDTIDTTTAPATSPPIVPAAPTPSVVEREPTAFDTKPAEPVAEPVTAKTKLRAFEDATFGKDAGRINGEVERGVGSPFARMTPEQKKQHAALERLVVAEQKLADASAELSKAEAAHEAAVKEAAASEQAVADQKAADEPVKPQPEPALAEH